MAYYLYMAASTITNSLFTRSDDKLYLDEDSNDVVRSWLIGDNWKLRSTGHRA